MPRVNARENFRIPDLGVTCVPDAARQIATPEPILLVEVLSPSNKSSTWSNIWAFSTIPSLGEVLVVDSVRVEVRVLTREADGTWPDNPTTVAEGEVRLPASTCR